MVHRRPLRSIHPEMKLPRDLMLPAAPPSCLQRKRTPGPAVLAMAPRHVNWLCCRGHVEVIFRLPEAGPCRRGSCPAKAAPPGTLTMIRGMAPALTKVFSTTTTATRSSLPQTGPPQGSLVPRLHHLPGSWIHDWPRDARDHSHFPQPSTPRKECKRARRYPLPASFDDGIWRRLSRLSSVHDS